jgi:hypothetical protein
MDIWLISYAPPCWVLLFGKEATLEGLNALSHIVGHEDGASLVTVIAHHDGAAFALDLLGTSIDGTLKEGKTLLAYPEHSGLKYYLIGIIDGCQKVGIHIGYDDGDALKDVMPSHIQEIARLAHIEEREIGIVINMPKLVHIGEAELGREFVLEFYVLLVLHRVGLLEERRGLKRIKEDRRGEERIRVFRFKPTLSS